MQPAFRLPVVALLAVLTLPVLAQEAPNVPVFRSQVNLVSLAAVVRDKRGPIVPSLGKADFDILENGHTVPLLEVRSERDAPANIALLIDGSGSMRLNNSSAVARSVSEQILSSLDQGRDEAALYSFDTRVLTLQAFTPELPRVRHALGYVETWGSTSLYDAISGVAGKIHEHAERRRAIIVFTDGDDTTSTLSSTDVATIASALDVPVYVFALSAPPLPAAHEKNRITPLADLAAQTGGLYFVATDQATLAGHVTTLLDELRHQHVLTFEASTVPGWRSLELHVRGHGYTVRTRGWYWSGDAAPPLRSAR